MKSPRASGEALAETHTTGVHRLLPALIDLIMNA